MSTTDLLNQPVNDIERAADQSERAWNALRGIVSKIKSPRKGAKVRIIDGRKHKGKEGVVFWHGQDKFNPPHRYGGNSMQAAMREALGKYGYRAGVQTASGEKFYVPAEYCEVLDSNDSAMEGAK